MQVACLKQCNALHHLNGEGNLITDRLMKGGTEADLLYQRQLSYWPQRGSSDVTDINRAQWRVKQRVWQRMEQMVHLLSLRLACNMVYLVKGRVLLIEFLPSDLKLHVFVLLLAPGNPTPEHRLCSRVGSGLFSQSFSQPHLSSGTLPPRKSCRVEQSLSLTNVTSPKFISAHLSISNAALHLSSV